MPHAYHSTFSNRETRRAQTRLARFPKSKVSGPAGIAPIHRRSRTMLFASGALDPEVAGERLPIREGRLRAIELLKPPRGGGG